jgi:hypothetical protein
MLSLLQHRDDIFTAALYLHAAALIIVNLTPTPKDDAIVARAYRVLEVLAGIVGARAKE